MSGTDYTAPIWPLTGAETLIVAQRDPATGRFRPRRVSLADVAAFVGAGQAARDAGQDAALAALSAREAAVEARPEEVAHFTAAARLPTLAAAASVTVRIPGLVPARSGDVLRAGEVVDVQPASDLPPGLAYDTPLAVADGTISLRLTAGLALAAGSAPFVWNVTAKR